MIRFHRELLNAIALNNIGKINITLERSYNYTNIIIRNKITFNYNVKWDTNIESIISQSNDLTLSEVRLKLHEVLARISTLQTVDVSWLVQSHTLSESRKKGARLSSRRVAPFTLQSSECCLLCSTYSYFALLCAYRGG